MYKNKLHYFFWGLYILDESTEVVDGLKDSNYDRKDKHVLENPLNLIQFDSKPVMKSDKW